MRTFVKENNFLIGMHHGWGNGYVVIPKGHKLHGIDYDKINVDVHYGLTFASLVTQELIKYWPELNEDELGSWVVGFDTAHYQDTLSRWPKEAVEYETERLKLGLMEL